MPWYQCLPLASFLPLCVTVHGIDPLWNVAATLTIWIAFGVCIRLYERN